MKQNRSVILKRRDLILNQVLQKGEVQVKDLCTDLDVSEITIRRDLQALEQQGALERYHGGARSRQSLNELLYFDDKSTTAMKEKNLIAQAVASMIQPGQTVFLNAGTTTLAVMSRLRDVNVRIITNNAMSTSALTGGACELICTGGEYQDRTRSFCGDLATHLISKVYADICILGVNGISVSGGVTTTAYNETHLNEMMQRRCQGQTIIAADGSKVGKTHTFTCMPLNKVSMLVTDSSADPLEVARIREQGVEVRIIDA